MVYISYFANIKNIPEDVEVVAICYKPPAWLPNIRNIRDLAPTGQIVRLYKSGKIDWDTYTALFYRDVIAQLDIANVIKQIGYNTCLCCYEANGSRCHRYLVASWLRSYGVEVKEI